jgi:Pyruvate/2-oxoacid:ferredoxin oxidoreductase delta subunit
MNVPTHSIAREENRCVGCVACSKACPTKAIRVRQDLMVVNPVLCIDCGECLRVCPHDAVRARTSSPSDLKRFKFTVAIPSSTVYTQFGHEVTPEQISGALLDHGFNAVYDGTWISPMVSSAVDTYLSECEGPWPKISVTCPAINRLILIRYPDLAPHLVPIHTPRELKAKMARRKFASTLGYSPDDIGIFYITPCSAIMQSIVQPVGLQESNCDGAFSVAELYGSMLRAIRAGRTATVEAGFDPRGLLWGVSGGESAGMRNLNTLAVSGVKDVTAVFDSIESGKFLNVDFLEAYICPDGCVSGQLLIEGRYAARHTLQRLLAQETGHRTPVKEEKVRSLFYQHFFDMEDAIKAPAIKPVAGNLQQAILRRQAKTRLVEQLPHKDCAACGAPDCATFAEDIVDGQAHLDDCLFLKLKSREPLPEGSTHE